MSPAVAFFRGGVGPSLWRLTEVRPRPDPISEAELIANIDQQAPDILPRAMLRMLMARVLAQQASDWNSYAQRHYERSISEVTNEISNDKINVQ
jgi:hypothetical protein